MRATRLRGKTDRERQNAYRALCRAQLDRAAIDDITLALNQSQRLGNARLLNRIEKLTGTRREARPRGRPRVHAPARTTDAEQRLLWG